MLTTDEHGLLVCLAGSSFGERASERWCDTYTPRKLIDNCTDFYGTHLYSLSLSPPLEMLDF